MRKKFFPVMGVCCGFLAVAFAIVLFAGGGAGVTDMATGTYTSYNYYGGDAYTGIQQAAADTARNVRDLALIVRSGFQGVSGTGTGFLLLVAGFGLIAFSLHTLNEMKARDHFEAQVLSLLKGLAPGAEIVSPAEKEALQPEPDVVSEPEPEGGTEPGETEQDGQ